MNIGGKFLEEQWAVSVLQYDLALSTGLINKCKLATKKSL